MSPASSDHREGEARLTLQGQGTVVRLGAAPARPKVSLPAQSPGLSGHADSSGRWPDVAFHDKPTALAQRGSTLVGPVDLAHAMNSLCGSFPRGSPGTLLQLGMPTWPRPAQVLVLHLGPEGTHCFLPWGLKGGRRGARPEPPPSQTLGTGLAAHTTSPEPAGLEPWASVGLGRPPGDRVPGACFWALLPHEVPGWGQGRWLQKRVGWEGGRGVSARTLVLQVGGTRGHLRA